jgi:hypothetical protein
MHHPFVAWELARALARQAGAPPEPRRPDCPAPEGRPPGPRVAARASAIRVGLTRRRATPAAGGG